MNALTKMTLTGYENSDYKGVYEAFTVQINPATIKWDKSIRYSKLTAEGNTNQPDTRYVGLEDDQFSFQLVLDGTGAVPGTKKTVPEQLNQLLKVIYNKVEESHESRYVILSWGALLFEGRTTSVSQQFTLFSAQGVPLRATVSLTFVSHLNKETANKKVNEQSPDLTREVTLKSGESIAFWCNEIYKDPSYCYDIARYNGLEGFRNIKPGVTLVFPPLDRDDR